MLLKNAKADIEFVVSLMPFLHMPTTASAQSLPRQDSPLHQKGLPNPAGACPPSSISHISR
ncbi:hypothetical protein P154DRAFT_319580 [Amniculicola lignicola CBS 123094]|uniref:Uncharacterized protein n=1 Tax=Amniculicola lignicola CBS 123094 TaxID=1392246 RepID=A0A6A5W3N2_9PLEO|nr:hypothetical protein P154DRAFT_319580 [Amniculicola lignicola CBS 123094]